ncbi:T9SS type B sorting domain-containing protein [Pedobacter sp. HMF7647]|uniref:T9SS type B sorting domain-containing protein n=1 Tax=Hufsiella arboris TaxID=2695275 RepID=A0A7K1YEB0_9SPHI|nr:gliding motility-associated C-terminal domain-containing protein [Hufsiella arboris]MXV52369.1 T9SS type B sorting domain-containing protein [Hufsiella arboris]
MINNRCSDVLFANTFTPNGDGINDTWSIMGVENDVTVTVRIYNRYGKIVFSSKGYPIPWNGLKNGERLPSGTYYYLIALKNDSQVLRGPVTIIY